MCGAPANIPHFSTATELANRSTIRYATWDEMPVGAIFFLGPLARPRYAGDTTYGAGDVGFKIDASRVRVSDGAGRGKPGVMTLAQREAQTGRRFQFGFGDLEGIPIDFGTVSKNTGIPTPPPEEDDMKLNAIWNFDGSIGIVDSAGLLHPVADMGTWNVLVRSGFVDDITKDPSKRQPDGSVWNGYVTRTAQAGEGITAPQIAALVVPAVLAGLNGAGGLTQAQIEAAAETAIKNVLAQAAK